MTAKRMTFNIFLMLLLLFASIDLVSVGYSQTHRIRNVEAGLSPRNMIKGQNPGMRLIDRMRHYNVPGVSIAVIDSGKIAWARGYGVLEAGASRKVNNETLFQAGSISKPVTAIAIFRLVQEGKLSLDADVNAYLKSWRVPESELTRQQAVTSRAILSHRGGFNISGFKGYGQGEAVPSILDILNGRPPANTPAIQVEFVPGTRYRYSGGGYTVLQLLLEDVQQDAFPAIIKREVFDPIGLQHSTFEQPLPAKSKLQAATGHTKTGDPIPGKWLIFPEMAAAGLWTTPTDLANIVIHVMRSLEGEPRSILKKSLADEMLTQVGEGQGLGFDVDGSFFGHDGSNKGFQASLIAFKHIGKGAIVMTNSWIGLSLAYEIMRSIALEYDWPAFRPIEKEVVQVDTKAYPDLVGEYRFIQGSDTIRVVVSIFENTLRAQSTYWQGYRQLYPLSEHRYFTLEGDWEMAFGKDESGRVRSMQFGPLEMYHIQK